MSVKGPSPGQKGRGTDSVYHNSETMNMVLMSQGQFSNSPKSDLGQKKHNWCYFVQKTFQYFAPNETVWLSDVCLALKDR